MRRERNVYQTSSAATVSRRERRTHADERGREIDEISVYKRAYGQRRPPLIPPNYSGNAFGAQYAAEEERVERVYGERVNAEAENGAGAELIREQEKEINDEGAEANKGSAAKAEKSRETPLFSEIFRSGLGSEELLILALIFMTAQGGGNDVLPYLVLLLFS